MSTPRSFFLKKRKALSPHQRHHHAKRASLHLPKLITHLPRRANIALYCDDFGELPTFVLVHFCLKNGYTPHLPIVQGKKLIFAPITPNKSDNAPKHNAKKRHHLGMRQPIARLYRHIYQMDACFCPLVAIDQKGNRLGMGGGFYDRTLKNYQGLKIGWCYDFQCVPTLDTNAWDIKMDIAISPSRLQRF